MKTGRRTFVRRGGKSRRSEPKTTLFGEAIHHLKTRFTAPDPLGDTGGDHDLYDYCIDDPVTMNDPAGLIAKESFVKTAGLMLAAPALYCIAGKLDFEKSRKMEEENPELRKPQPMIKGPSKDGKIQNKEVVLGREGSPLNTDHSTAATDGVKEAFKRARSIAFDSVKRTPVSIKIEEDLDVSAEESLQGRDIRNLTRPRATAEVSLKNPLAVGTAARATDNLETKRTEQQSTKVSDAFGKSLSDLLSFVKSKIFTKTTDTPNPQNNRNRLNNHPRRKKNA